MAGKGEHFCSPFFLAVSGKGKSRLREGGKDFKEKECLYRDITCESNI